MDFTSEAQWRPAEPPVVPPSPATRVWRPLTTIARAHGVPIQWPLVYSGSLQVGAGQLITRGQALTVSARDAATSIGTRGDISSDDFKDWCRAAATVTFISHRGCATPTWIRC